jgi:transcriptional regulator with XRE-family HTH domain
VRIRSHLRELRGTRPISVAAEETGLNKGVLSMIERGRQLPTDAEALALAPFYGPAASWYAGVDPHCFGLVRATLLPDAEQAEEVDLAE